MAARGAFWYSLAWCLVMFVVYFMMSFVTGLFSVPDYIGGRLNLGDPRVLILTLPTMATLVVTMLTAFWTAGLAAKGLFTAGESKTDSVRMLIYGVALVVFYGGVVSGLLRPG